MFVVLNSGSVPVKILLLARANCLITTFPRKVLPVVFDCLQPITSQPREKLASTPTPGGMKEIISLATIERSAYCECVSSWSPHQPVMTGMHNVLLISIGLQWYSLRSGSICVQLFRASGGEFKKSLVAVNKRAARSHHLGVISAPLLGVKYFSSSLYKSYGSKDD